MILSEKSATFRDHAVASPSHFVLPHNPKPQRTDGDEDKVGHHDLTQLMSSVEVFDRSHDANEDQ